MKTPELKVALVNMPFASLGMPSLALTQIATVLKERFDGRVVSSTHYLSHDFAHYLGDTAYYDHAIVGDGYMTGIGDWFFRGVAFPDAPDNAEEYFGRFYFSDDEETQTFRRVYGEKREGLSAFLDALIDRYELATADVVGFTTLFAQAVGSFALAQRLKERKPEIVTVIGGAAVDGVLGQEFARQVPQMDYIFSGPGLVSFSTFIENLLEGRPEANDGIGGVFSKTNRDRWMTGDAAKDALRINPDAPLVALMGEEMNVDKNVLLDYEPFLASLESAFPEKGIRPVLLFETSRGCWWAEKSVCTFCGLNGLRQTQHWMSPENAKRQIESLYQWVPRATSFIAVDTIIPPVYIREVFPDIHPPAEMKMLYELRAVLSDEEIEILVRAGVVAFQPGIEALSTSSLKLMHKGTTVFQNLQFLKTCSRHAVSLDWNLLINSPGESEDTFETYDRNLPLIRHLAPPSGVYPIAFVRYSRYFDDPETYGLKLRAQDFYALTYPFDPPALENIAYYFVNEAAGENNRVDHWLETLNHQVDDWKTRWTGGDQRPQARLCYVNDGDDWAVYDSRDGGEKEYDLSPCTKRVLDYLDKPTTVKVVQNVFKNEPAFDARREIDRLCELGLLFEENGRYFNLVVGV